MNKTNLMENFTMHEMADMVIELSEKVLRLEDRHMSDCITINQLQTTIDVLTNRYAKLREQVGL